MKNIAIILAAGKGERFKETSPKQFAKLAGKKVIEYVIEIFEKNKMIDDIIIVSNPNYVDYMWDIIKLNKFEKVKKIVNGGTSRFESTYHGLKALEGYEDNDNILIHDGVRPFVNDEIIDRCIAALKHYSVVDTAIDSSDTIIEIDENSFIRNIPKRYYMKRGQTPQAFKLGVIKKAYQNAILQNKTDFTCDCSVCYTILNEKIYVVKGDEKNIKITYPVDLYIAEKFIQMGIGGYEMDDIDLNNLKNKNIIIFGHSSGIGKEIDRLARFYGANVFGGSRVSGVDISYKENIKSFLEKVSAIDIAIITAGILVKKPFELLNDEEILKQIQVNYIGVINIAKLILPYLKRSKGMLITFASSSYTKGRANYSIYSSTKAAIVNLTQALSAEWEIYGIKVNCINPERTKTPMREKNFGYEAPSTLLDPKDVAIKTLKLALTNVSGLILDVRK